MSYLDFGIDGFIIAMNIGEMLIFVGYLMVLLFIADPRTVGLSVTNFEFSKLCTHLTTSTKYTLSAYSEYLILEINTLYITMLSDTIQLAAWVQLMNITQIIYFVGSGISNILRTRVNSIFGLLRPEICKKFYWWFLKINFVLSSIICVFMLVFRFYIASVYT